MVWRPGSHNKAGEFTQRTKAGGRVVDRYKAWGLLEYFSADITAQKPGKPISPLLNHSPLFASFSDDVTRAIWFSALSSRKRDLVSEEEKERKRGGLEMGEEVQGMTALCEANEERPGSRDHASDSHYLIVAALFRKERPRTPKVQQGHLDVAGNRISNPQRQLVYEEPTVQFLVVEGNPKLDGGVSGMVGRSRQASGDMCGRVRWEERMNERSERKMIDENESGESKKGLVQKWSNNSMIATFIIRNLNRNKVGWSSETR
ncbi:hypothetical protein Q8A73_006455 [Channa argus]|nr:hypothetical protein Q8A73_006455 [Channa argus]